MTDEAETHGGENRPIRADARRNLEALLRAAMAVFATSGVDAPVREIAEKAGVGVGTVYRHFPQRSDLIKAIVRQEVDACAEAAAVLRTDHAPGEALDLWMQRLVDFVMTKRGLAAALHSGDPAYQSLPDYFLSHLTPALQSLLDGAVTAGAANGDVNAGELLLASARLATLASKDNSAQARRMVALLVDGLRYRAETSVAAPRK